MQVASSLRRIINLYVFICTAISRPRWNLKRKLEVTEIFSFTREQVDCGLVTLRPEIILQGCNKLHLLDS